MGNCHTDKAARQAVLAELVRKAKNLGLDDQVVAVTSLGLDDQISNLELAIREKELAIREKETSLQKASGEYWHCIDQVWKFVDKPFTGCFEAGKKLRQHNSCRVYAGVHSFLAANEGFEAILAANSVFSFDEVSTIDSSEHSQREERTRRENSQHDRDYLKNFLGETKNKSRAHLFPRDKDCNQFWWPAFQLITGHHDSDFNQRALNMVASMRTNKIVFPVEHNHIFDTLKNGIVCTIPIYESIEEMAKWQYTDGFKMLVVCDAADTYKTLGMVQEENYGHIQIASETEVRWATNLVGEVMKILADSLVTNWEGHYKKFDESNRKKMLSTMREKLTKDPKDQTVRIPIYGLKEDEKPKLYTIDYSALYKNDPQGAKYIHDAYSASAKSAVNLSAFVNQQEKSGNYKDCKFLPSCPSSDDDTSIPSFDILDRLGREETNISEATVPATISLGPIGREIEVHEVTDDEEEGEKEELKRDSASIASDITA